MQSIRQYHRYGEAIKRSLNGTSLTSGLESASERTTDRAKLHEALGVTVQQDETTKNELFLVNWTQPNDPEDPKQWSHSYKWAVIVTVGFAGFLVGWASSIDSAVIPQAKVEFGVSTVAESLATALYLIGFGFGALFSGPLSETFGRNPVFLSTLFLFGVSILGAALAPNFGAQLVFRLLAGFCGATPLTTFGGSMADMFDVLERTYVFPVMACMSFLGPFLAPLVGEFIGQSGVVTWRWSEWTTLIMTGLVFGGIALLAPETYTPTLLEWKAAHLRRLTGDDRYVAATALKSIPLVQRMKVNMTRPFEFFLLEPIVMAFTLYLSVIYVVLFTFLTAFDFIFGPEGVYGLTQGQEGLCFIGLNVGFMIAMAFCPWVYSKYKRAVQDAERAGQQVEPEQRLWYAMISAPFVPISLFWMGWTSYSSVSVWSPIVATVFFGFAMQGIFITSYQYLIDSYESYAASALVSLTFFRYLLAGIMVVVSIPMYSNIGVHWSLTILGCISVLMTPVPYVLYRYGHKIRQRSKFTDHN